MYISKYLHHGMYVDEIIYSHKIIVQNDLIDKCKIVID